MKNLTFGQLKGEGGGKEYIVFKTSEAPYRTVVPTYTENFSTLAQLESVYKWGELESEEKERKKTS